MTQAVSIRSRGRGNLGLSELTTMFSAMLRRMPDMELAGEVSWAENGEPPSVTGPYEIPVRFTSVSRVVEHVVDPIFA